MGAFAITERVNMKVGDTKTLYANELASLVLAGQPAWTSSRPSDVQVVSWDMYSCNIKATNSFSGYALVQCRYYYRELDPITGQYIYQRQGYINYHVFVSANSEQTVSLDLNEVVFTDFTRIQINAKVNPADNNTTYTWATSNRNVATVSGNKNTATIFAVGTGTCDITVTINNGAKATCKVTVPSGDPTNVSLSPSELSITVGESYKLKPALTPSNASTVYQWRSSNPAAASVSSSGEVTGVSRGEATITVSTANNLTAECKVTVKEAPVAPENVSIPNSMTIAEGYTSTLIPVLSPPNASTSYTWKSSEITNATVDSKGKVTGKKAGETNITVTTKNGKTGNCKITVITPPEGADSRNARVRIQKIKELVQRSIDKMNL